MRLMPRIRGLPVRWNLTLFDLPMTVGLLTGHPRWRCQLYRVPGQMVAFVGPSGAGKSTIINLVPRFFDCAGTIRIDGADIAQVTLKVRRNVALVSQDAVLFDDSIVANIAFGRPSASRQKLSGKGRSA